MSVDTSEVLDRLSGKQREVMELVLDRRTNKEIAFALGISESAVEQRISVARVKLGAATRADAARLYEDLTCGFPTGGKTQLHPAFDFAHQSSRVASDLASFVLADSASAWPPLPSAVPANRSVLEMLDDRFGIWGRVCAVPLLAAGLAMFALVMLSVADATDRLIGRGIFH